MLSKPISEWTEADIQTLNTDETPEDYHLEFKGDLAVPKGASPDDWHTTHHNVGNEARFDISKEIVAFANAGGGLIVLGVEEKKTAANQNVAGGIKALPHCEKLADVLRLGCRDLIAPKLERLEFRGVTIGSGHEGCVLIDVPQSRLRPHRAENNRHCYIRRGESAVPMSMDEIKDLTLYAVTAQQRFDDGMLRMQSHVAQYFLSSACKAYRMSVVLMPLNAVPLPKLSRTTLHRITKTRHWGQYQWEDGRPPTPLQMTFPITSDDWHPMFRGVRTATSRDGRSALRELHENACIVCALGSKEGLNQDGQRQFTFGGLLAMIITALQDVTFVAKETRIADLAYGMSIKVETSGTQFTVADIGYDQSYSYGNLPAEPFSPPIYSVTAEQDFDELLTEIDRDFWNAMGIDNRRMVKVNWAS